MLILQLDEWAGHQFHCSERSYVAEGVGEEDGCGGVEKEALELARCREIWG